MQDVHAGVVSREPGHAELRSQGQQPVLSRPGIFAAHLHDLAVTDIPVDDSPADTVSGLQQQDRAVRRQEVARGSQPGQSGTNHQHVRRLPHDASPVVQLDSDL